MVGQSLDAPRYQALKAFLAAKSRPAGTLRYHQLQGFLFAVACAPETVLPSEWMPIVFADQHAPYRDHTEAQLIAGELVALYNEINDAVARGRPKLPADCAFRDDLLANLKLAAPVSQWSQGFIVGHDWLRDVWQAYIPDDHDLGMAVMTLSFFASRRLAGAYRRELDLPQPLEIMARALRDLFPVALIDYAGLGRPMARAIRQAESRARAPKRRARRRRPK